MLPNSDPFADQVPTEALKEVSFSNDPVKMFLQLQVHSTRAAVSFLNQITDAEGKIRAGTDAVRVEKALNICKQVIESVKKARQEMQTHYEQEAFEKAVVAAVQAIPTEYGQQFMDALKAHLDEFDKRSSAA